MLNLNQQNRLYGTTKYSTEQLRWSSLILQTDITDQILSTRGNGGNYSSVQRVRSVCCWSLRESCYCDWRDLVTWHFSSAFKQQTELTMSDVTTESLPNSFQSLMTSRGLWNDYCYCSHLKNLWLASTLIQLADPIAQVQSIQLVYSHFCSCCGDSSSWRSSHQGPSSDYAWA